MTDLTSSMLDSVRDMEGTMKSIYKTDYEKRGEFVILHTFEEIISKKKFEEESALLSPTSYLLLWYRIIFPGLPVTRYRPLMAAIDSPVELPITPVIIDLKDAYRDPTRFKSSAMESLTIQPIKTTYPLNDKHGNKKYKNGITNSYTCRVYINEKSLRLQTVKIFLFHVLQ